MNWGYRILIIYISFVLMISFLIYLCSGQRSDLVSEDYYNQEIKFQEQVEKIRNAADGHKKISINFNRKENLVDFRFPPAEKPGSTSGNIRFFKPDNASEDFVTAIHTNAENGQIISTAAIHSGKWLVKISWTDGIKEYYQEDGLYIK
jgi:nitrogen fixation protein FixH